MGTVLWAIVCVFFLVAVIIAVFVEEPKKKVKEN